MLVENEMDRAEKWYRHKKHVLESLKDMENI